MLGRTTLALCAPLLPCAFTAEADASPWNRSNDQLLTISKSVLSTSEAGSAEDGTLRKFEQSSAELYAEYGLTDGIQLGGKLAYAWQATQNEEFHDALNGFTVIEGFAQVQLHNGDGVALALLGTVAAATDTSSRVIEGRSFERDGAAGMSLLAGWSKGNTFATAKAGPAFSFGDDADFFIGELSLGQKIGPRAMLIADMFVTQSLGGADRTGADYSVVRAGPSIVLPFYGRIRMQIGGTADIAADNIDKGLTGFIGFWVGAE